MKKITQIDKLRKSKTIDRSIKDYFLLKKDTKDIFKEEEVNSCAFYSYLREIGKLPYKKYYAMLDFGDEELNRTLKDKYAGIVSRCKNKREYKRYPCDYFGKEYLAIYEWVEFCKTNMKRIMDLWTDYIKSNKDPSKAISVDRIDNDKGYTVDNIQLVTFGYNSWKRNLNPSAVKYKDNKFYGMSLKDVGSKIDVSRQVMSQVLHGKKKFGGKYKVSKSSIEEVLNKNNVKSIEEYYDKYVRKEALLCMQK